MGGDCSPRDQTRHETLCPGITRHCPELGDPHPGEKATPLTPQMLSRPAWVTCPWAQWSQDVLGPRSGLRSEKKKKMNFYIEENDSVSDVNREPICLHTNVVVTRLLGTATKPCPPLCRGFEVAGYREAGRTPPTPEARGAALEGVGLGATCGSQVTAVVLLQVLIRGRETDVTEVKV